MCQKHSVIEKTLLTQIINSTWRSANTLIFITIIHLPFYGNLYQFTRQKTDNKKLLLFCMHLTTIHFQSCFLVFLPNWTWLADFVKTIIKILVSVYKSKKSIVKFIILSNTKLPFLFNYFSAPKNIYYRAKDIIFFKAEKNWQKVTIKKLQDTLKKFCYKIWDQQSFLQAVKTWPR